MSNNAIINFLFNSQGAVNQLNDFKNKFSNVVSSIEKSGIGTFGALGASLASIFSVKSLVDHTKTIDDLHTAYNSMSLEQISLFSNLYELLGGTDKEATDLLKRTKDLIYQLDKGEAPAFLAEMGLRSRDAEGRLKDSVTFLEELREKMKTFSPDQQTRFLEQLGIYSTPTKRYMNLQGEELKRYTEQAAKMGIVSEESISRIRNFEESIAKLRGSFRKLGDTLLKAGIGKLIDNITEALDKFCELPEPTQQGIMLIVGGLLALKPLLGIARSVFALTEAFVGLIAAVSAPLIGVAFLGFLAAVVLNLGGVKDKLDETLKSYKDWVKEVSKEQPISGLFLKQFGDLAEHILHPIEKLKEAYNKLAEVFGFAKIGTENESKTDLSKYINSDIGKNLNSEVLGISNGSATKELAEARTEINTQNDNKNIDLTFYANFNGLDSESSSNIMGEFTKWGSSIDNALNATLKQSAINFGGR